METSGERRYPVAGSSALIAEELVSADTPEFDTLPVTKQPNIRVVESNVSSPVTELDDRDAAEAENLPALNSEHNQSPFLRIEGKIVDERKLAASSLVRNFRVRDINTVVLKTQTTGLANRQLYNEHLSAQGATYSGTIAKLTKMADKSANEEYIIDQISDLERLFASRFLKPGKIPNWSALDSAADKYADTDLMRNTDIFRAVMFDFHGQLYIEFCERLRRFGGFILLKET